MGRYKSKLNSTSNSVRLKMGSEGGIQVLHLFLNTDPKEILIQLGLGVTSATIEGADKDQIAVVGDGVDSIDLTKLLRKRMGSTELVSVTPMDEKKKEEKEKETPEATIAWPYQYYPFVPQQYFVYETPYSFI